MTLMQDDMKLLFEVVGMYAAWTGFLFYALGWALFRGFDLVFWAIRKRGARVSFAERARAAEARAGQWAMRFQRIAERNSREAARRAGIE